MCVVSSSLCAGHVTHCDMVQAVPVQEDFLTQHCAGLFYSETDNTQTNGVSGDRAVADSIPLH